MNTINPIKIKAFNYITVVDRMMERTNELQINYFYYSKLFNDGTRVSLSNESRWFKDFTIKYNNIGVVSNNFNSYEEGFMLWPVFGKEEVYYRMLNEYNITNQITLVLKHSDCTELFTLATDNSRKNMHNIYLNKLDVIYNFSIIMKDKIKTLIGEIDSDRFIHNKLEIVDTSQVTRCEKNDTIIHYLKRINRNRELVSHLTDREFECLLLLLEGKSAKVISSIMNISNRTVEVHIYNIKKKMSCRSRAELISKIIKNPFLN